MRKQAQCAICSVRRAATAEKLATRTERVETETYRVHTTVDAFAGVSLSVVKALLTGWRGAKAQSRRAKLQCDFSCLASIAGKVSVRQGLNARLHTLVADQWRCLQERISSGRQVPPGDAERRTTVSSAVWVSELRTLNTQRERKGR